MLQCVNDNAFVCEDCARHIPAFFVIPAHDLTHRIRYCGNGDLDGISLLGGRLGELYRLRIRLLACLDGDLLVLLIHIELDVCGVAEVGEGCAVELDEVTVYEGDNGFGAGCDKLHEFEISKY